MLDLVGSFTIDHGAQHLKDKINSLIAQHRTLIVLISRTCPISTAVVLGSWWRPSGSVMMAKGALKLMNISSRNHDLLSITRLVTLFELFDSQAEAVQSFQTFAPVPVTRS